jgi:hypothetical protein
LSERERLALIGILIEFPTYYSVVSSLHQGVVTILRRSKTR